MTEIIEQARNVHRVKQYYAGSQEFWYLLSADHHWDNPDSNHELIEKHLKQCKERGAMAFIFGDFFCAMQGKYDKRSDKGKLRPEHQSGPYLDRLVDTAAEWLMPYREHIGVIGQGNHETAIMNRHETNLIAGLVKELNRGTKEGDHLVYMGGYGGWVRLLYEHASGGNRKSVNIKYYHGHGGGGPVTKGSIQSQRQAVMLPDADIVVSGHVHEEYMMTFTRERINDSGKITLQDQHHLRIPTYKDEYKDGYGGWHVETGKPPKPIGAWWLKVTVNGEGIHYDFLRAK